jgi:hypothetical protein
MTIPQSPDRRPRADVPNPDETLETGYPDAPDNAPGLVGGPATEAVPGSHRCQQKPATVTDDGGETTMPGRPRETGGARAAPGHEQHQQVNT